MLFPSENRSAYGVLGPSELSVELFEPPVAMEHVLPKKMKNDSPSGKRLEQGRWRLKFEGFD
jgi:hypothetical protein